MKLNVDQQYICLRAAAVEKSRSNEKEIDSDRIYVRSILFSGKNSDNYLTIAKRAMAHSACARSI